MRPKRNSPWIFHVQVGYKSKGAYRNKYCFDSLQMATFYYQCINIGRGYKKRLITRTGRVLFRSAS